MLEEIRISNFAIIDQLELAFGHGLNVITGETGAGKSIIIDAVELLLGGKADTTMVRSGADKAIVEGTFALNQVAKNVILPILEREDLIQQGDSLDHLMLSREIRANGRSSARLNGFAVRMDLLEEVGAALVDVHGQSAHLSLFKPGAHLDLLDRYADLMEMRDALATVVGRLSDVRREMRSLLEDEAAQERRAERLRREIEEIDAAELVPGEDDDLKAERSRLANSETLAKLAAQAAALLNGDDSMDDQMCALDQVIEVASILGKLAHIDESLKDDYDLAEEAAAQIEELAVTMRRYAQSVEYNPGRLDEVEERLELIGSLKRRYGVSIQLILEHADNARHELDGIENSAERLEELAKHETALLKHIGELGERISRARQAAARHLSEGIIAELGDLRMARAVFEVQIERVEAENGCFVGSKRYAFDTTGIDHVEFLMSANPGEPLRPLAKVASGGEAARIMLALKRVLTQADQTPTLIFDEIDQGIGGRVGSIVGEKLWGLTGEHQVLVVTHMAQLAGFADRHYRVQKYIDKDRTRTEIIPLSEEHDRVEELAAMLGTINESGMQSARELLIEAGNYKRAHFKPNGETPSEPTQQPLL